MTCKFCGNPIPAARLAAYPNTVTCSEEHGRRQRNYRKKVASKQSKRRKRLKAAGINPIPADGNTVTNDDVNAIRDELGI